MKSYKIMIRYKEDENGNVRMSTKVKNMVTLKPLGDIPFSVKSLLLKEFLGNFIEKVVALKAGFKEHNDKHPNMRD